MTVTELTDSPIMTTPTRTPGGPMSQPTISEPIGTVVYERTIQVRQFEPAKASIHMQFPVDPNDPAKTMESAKAAMLQAKAVVFEELGLQFQLDENGVLRELVEHVFGTVTDVSATEAQNTPPQFKAQPPAAPVSAAMAAVQGAAAPTPQAAAPAPQPAPAAPTPVAAGAGGGTLAARPPYHPRTQDKSEKAANEEWGWAHLNAHPDQWWDNRGNKQNPRSPDFKHKDSGLGLWEN